MQIRRILFTLFIGLVVLLSSVSCGGGGTVQNGGTLNSDGVVISGGIDAISGWPSALPIDGVQPWEKLDAHGYVVPTMNSHTVSAISTTSNFTPGRERFLDAGTVSNRDEASTLIAGPAADRLSWAMYRVSMGGAQPGAVSIDADLWPTAVSNKVSQYYVGLSDYTRGAWDWQGPFSAAQIRLTLESGNWLSPLGNLFVCVAVYEDSKIDLVGIGINPVDHVDTTAPPLPAALAATPVEGGLLLEWTSSVAGDLAGYRIYWSYSPISSPTAAGVNRVNYLEGLVSHVLPVEQIRTTYVRVSALDTSGNESDLSPMAQGMPLTGPLPYVVLTSSEVSGSYGVSADLTATGMDVYDWDLDGDGVFDITDDATGMQIAVLMKPGIIRPAVRGRNTGGTCIARGAVSLIVTGNTRPAASCVVSPSQGQAPLTVSYTGEASDAEDQPAELRYSWDINGDGIYVGSGSWNSLTPPNGTYSTAGLYNVKFRVEDSQGAWDVDSMAVQVEETASTNQPPVPACSLNHYFFDTVPVTVEIDPSGSSDPDGTIVKYEWDFDGDYIFDSVTYSGLPVRHTYTEKGRWGVGLQVTDDEGATGYISTPVTCGGGWPMEGGDPYRSHFQFFPGPMTNHEAYKLDITTFGVMATPVVSDEGFIYVLDENNNIFSLYPDLTLRWTKTLPSVSVDTTGLALDREGNVYAVDAGGYCICYTPEGTTIWIRDLGTSICSRPLLDQERLRYYILAQNGDLYCLDSRTGVPIWNSPYSAGANISESSPTLDKNGNVYFGDMSGNLHAVDLDGISLAWAPYFSGINESIRSSPAYDSWTHSIVFCVSNSPSMKGTVFKVYVEDGTLLWSVAPGETSSYIDASPAVDGFGRVFVGTWDDKVYGLDSYNGTLLPGWPVSTGDDIDSCDPIVDIGNRVYVGSWDKKVYCFSESGSLEWESATSSDSFTAALAMGPAGKLYAINKSGELIVFDGQ